MTGETSQHKEATHMCPSILGILCALAVCGTALEATAVAQAPQGQYTTTIGTAHDNKTGLTWERSPGLTPISWSVAKTYCAGLGATLGGTGWRVPTAKELQTIVDDSRSGPSIDTSVFGMAQLTFFWSSSVVFNQPTNPWAVDFGAGFMIPGLTMANVRCVMRP
jgi:Protein of unknown function (DUF1566)